MSRVLAIAIAVLVVAGALATWGMYAGVTDAPDPLQIVEIEGEVQRDRDGIVTPGRVGMHLAPGDRLATGADGSAVLTRGAGAELRVGPDASVAFVAVDEGVLEMSLERGTVRARVRPDAGAVRIAQGDRAIVATDATFGVAVGDDGQLTVESERGEVAVSGVVGASRVGPGRRLVAFPDGTTYADAVPADLLLDVAWPGTVLTDSVEVAGKADPGAQVTIAAPGGSATVRADASGAFGATVPLAPGENRVAVHVDDPMGRSRDDEATVLREAKPPTVRLQEGRARR